MITARLARWRRFLEALFPERHIYIRSSGEMRGVVLTTGHQVALAAGVGAVGLWASLGGVAIAVLALSGGANSQETLRTKAYYERLIADRQARLNSAVAQLSDTNGSFEEMAQATEKRHAALAMLFSEIKGAPGAAQALAPASMKTLGGHGPADELRAVRADQDRLIAEAETFARSRADRLRLAFRLAGLDPDAFSHADPNSLGGPLIDAKDPRALAAVLDVDEEFAARIQHAADDLSGMHALADASNALPLARPTTDTSQASGFGVRIDPFTGRPAFHPGLDFAGPIMTPVYSTAPGVVSFTGVRNGYGNTVEIDHGHGLKTRFAHLAAISVSVGEHVGVHQRIGGIGSTGRSTGPHLHYEVWVDGRPQNPERFVRAGDYVQQTSG
ncbi:MAG: peptidoglycan DD-metalloendopeptidase family protein [Caulobacteraceae bacterium]|nr:peptidoglycan DD-metalloendopeptidase family protein [Caulobacteraceae bacterium]